MKFNVEKTEEEETEKYEMYTMSKMNDLFYTCFIVRTISKHFSLLDTEEGERRR